MQHQEIYYERYVILWYSKYMRNNMQQKIYLFQPLNVTNFSVEAQ